eukprot:c8649_g1_i1.p1 GENE.c8649_g1_i1~~c8649_g1_i1.p1  ORF type:complete len:180 (+),score=48.02 c8649_g1_i1:315-854(+)
MHEKDASVARGLKFRRFFSEMFVVGDVDDAVRRATEAYSMNCMKLYRQLQPVPEALEFAKLASESHVISGTDDVELKEVFHIHNLDNLFRSVRGSPTTKNKHLTDIMQECGVDQSHVLFVGDGFTDFKTAKSLNVHFCFLSCMTDWKEHSTIMHGATNVTQCQTWNDILERVAVKTPQP